MINIGDEKVMLHSILSFLTVLLIWLICFEVLQMILRTARVHWVVKNLRNRFVVMRFLLIMKVLPKVMEGESLVIPCGKIYYRVNSKDGVLNLAGIYLKLEEDLTAQLKPLVKSAFEMIEEESNKLLFKKSIIKQCKDTEAMIEELQTLMDTVNKEGEMV